MPKKKMTLDAAKRIYSATSRKNDGIIPKNSFAARAMRIATKGSKPN